MTQRYFKIGHDKSIYAAITSKYYKLGIFSFGEHVVTFISIPLNKLLIHATT